jgi:hypothetical protein
VLDDRHWRWLLLHPDLGDEYIHPSKSTFPSLPPHMPCTGFPFPDSRREVSVDRVFWKEQTRSCASCLPLFPATETLGTIKNIKPMVRHRGDYSVVIGKWRPSPQQPEPPISAVLMTPFWSDEQYAGVRARLRRPLTETNVQFSGSFVSINTRTKQWAVGGDEEVPQPSTPDAPVWLLPMLPTPAAT